MGRGSKGRILIAAPKTSSLGNTIWYRHRETCEPAGWSLRVGAHFATSNCISSLTKGGGGSALMVTLFQIFEFRQKLMSH